jgi:Xaa-Pro aminopeptidase
VHAILIKLLQGVYMDYSYIKQRRSAFLNALRAASPGLSEGVVLLFGEFEQERISFRQGSSFYYLTGVSEPGAVFCMYLDGREVLYLPQYNTPREKWVTTALAVNEKAAAQIEVDEIKYLGEATKGYSLGPFFNQQNYTHLLEDITPLLTEEGGTLFVIGDNSTPAYAVQMWGVNFLLSHMPSKIESIMNIAPLIHDARRSKDKSELQTITDAIAITTNAHMAVAQAIKPGKNERDIQATLEFVFTSLGSQRPAFPSIVATGKNTTVLHYLDRNKEIGEKDLVVVDIGAEYDMYASDLTRTFPASGSFSARQKEIYLLVLQCQKYVESFAKPGMFLRNSEHKERSLHFLAEQFFEKAGYKEYFYHGIGHYLGLDVHDVGDYKEPLRPGDVITIEPGLYIADENLGVRIEDNYLITQDGCVCLSSKLPKEIDHIEQMMKGQM